MKCHVCGEEKLREQFSYVDSAPCDESLGIPENNLVFACLQCIQQKLTQFPDIIWQLVDEPTKCSITKELEYRLPSNIWSKISQPVQNSSQYSGQILVSFLQTFVRVPVSSDTTVKAVKIFLGQHMEIDPKCFRLLFEAKELKVVQNRQLALLRSYGVTSGARITGLVSLSSRAGQSRIDGFATDSYGNSTSELGDLGQDGGLQGYTICVLQLYTGEGFTFNEPKLALQQKGFEVILWQNAVPALTTFQTALGRANQLWVISTNSDVIPSSYINAIREFNLAGKSLYLWGENDPYNVAVNSVLRVVVPGVTLKENYHACQHVRERQGNSGPGFVPHHIFTGIQQLYEGATIARFSQVPANYQCVMWSSEGQPALIVSNVSNTAQGRIAIDVAFTRLFWSWDNAGTARFVKNIATWLCALDDDWI